MLQDARGHEHEVIADTMQRPRLRMTARERLAEGLLSVGFAAAAVLFWLLDPPGGFAVLPAVVCIVVLV